MVVEVTSHIRGIPVEVRIGRREGLRRPCVANLDNVHVVNKDRLQERIGWLADSKVSEVKRALGHALAWPELIEP
jgi:mRNA-degrading endonuclease toxin of MazEF toxin-antitoxin module